MATLPRFEPMGVQYADLPRVSTAAQQVAAEGFSRMSQNLDRMLGFLQSELETKAQREAKKYAIENPPTKEQIDKAVETGQFPQIEGAGRIFQQTYEAMAGTMLSSQLQAEGQRKIGQVLEAVKAGGAIDPIKLQTDLKDMIDGYAVSVAALDPEESIRLRARLTLAGNAVFEQASAQAIKRDQEQLNAGMQSMADNFSPVAEAIIAKSGQIDPATGKPVDVERMLAAQIKPFQDLVQTTGDRKPLDKALAQIQEAKLGSLVATATDSAFAATGAEALRKLAAGDAGSLSGIYKGLAQKDKETVRKRVRDYFVDQTNAAKADEDARKADAKRAANALELELLNPKTTIDRQRQIVNTLVSSDQMTLAAAKSWLEPKKPDGNVLTELQLMDRIRSGNIQTLEPVLAEAGNLSDVQILRIGNYLRNEAYRTAEDKLKAEAGILGFELNPSEAKIRKLKELRIIFNEQVESGALPVKAADSAINAYNANENVKAYDARRQKVNDSVSKILESKGYAMPNVAIEEMDIGALKDSRGRPIPDDLRKLLQTELNKLGARP